jgi:glucan-binding YG repeat protein
MVAWERKITVGDKSEDANGNISAYYHTYEFNINVEKENKVVNSSSNYSDQPTKIYIGYTTNFAMSGYDNASLSVKSNNEKIATAKVDGNNIKITGVSKGETTIDATFTTTTQTSTTIKTTNYTMVIKVNVVEVPTVNDDNTNTNTNTDTSNNNQNSNTNTNTTNNTNDTKKSDDTTEIPTKTTVTTTDNKKKAGSWHQDSTGWWYDNGDGTYIKNSWAKIDNTWYYFDAYGYMESNCYRDGCWLGSNGAWDPNYSSGKWMKNSKGWWYQDGTWYPVSQWVKINGDWYYFKSNGYMATDEWIDGYYLDSNGVCQ